MSGRHGGQARRHGGPAIMIPGASLIIDGGDDGTGRRMVADSIRSCLGADPKRLTLMLMTAGPAFEREAGHAALSGASVTSASEAPGRDVMMGEIGEELDRRAGGGPADPMVVVMSAPAAVCASADPDRWDDIRRLAHDGPHEGMSLVILAEGDDAATVSELLGRGKPDGISVIRGVHAGDARRLAL